MNRLVNIYHISLSFVLGNMIPVVAMLMRSRLDIQISKVQLCHKSAYRPPYGGVGQQKEGKIAERETPQNRRFSHCLILYPIFEADLLYMNIANRPAPTIA